MTGDLLIPIGEFIRGEALNDMHDDYYEGVVAAARRFEDHRPRVDTRENLFLLEEELEELHQAACEAADFELTRAHMFVEEVPVRIVVLDHITKTWKRIFPSREPF